MCVCCNADKSRREEMWRGRLTHTKVPATRPGRVAGPLLIAACQATGEGSGAHAGMREATPRPTTYPGVSSSTVAAGTRGRVSRHGHRSPASLGRGSQHALAHARGPVTHRVTDLHASPTLKCLSRVAHIRLSSVLKIRQSQLSELPRGHKGSAWQSEYNAS